MESLCLPCTHALSGNDVNRVKRFQGPRGRKTLRDFGVWLVECNEENTLMRLVFLCRLLPYVAPTVQCRLKLADGLVHSLSSTPFHWRSAPSGQPSSALWFCRSRSFFSLCTMCSSPLRNLQVWLFTRFLMFLAKSKPPSGTWDMEQVHFMSCMFIINILFTGWCNDARLAPP